MLSDEDTLISAQKCAEEQIGLVSAHRVLERQTRDLEELVAVLRATLESTTDGILVTDGRGRVTDFNQRYLEMWRIPPDVAERGIEQEVREHASRQLTDPDAFLRRTTEIYALAPSETEEVLSFRDGRIFERRSRVQRVDQRIIGRVWSFRDITQETQSAITSRRLAAIVDCSDDAIVGKDLNLIVTSWNAAAERIFGYTAEEMIGSSILRIVPPDRRREEDMIREKITRGQRVEPMETVRVAKGGRLVEISVTISPIKDSNGKVVGASKVARDITERKRAERALAESHSLLQAVIDNTEDAIYVKDLDLRYRMINPAGTRFLKRSAEDIIGRSDEDFFSAGDAAMTMAYDRRVIDSETSQTFEDTNVFSGVPLTFLSTKSPFRDENGMVTGVVGISRDISERKRQEEALKIAKNEAEEANHAKSEFLSRMSHELRTPLNSILGFSQLLEAGTLSAKERDWVGYVRRAGNHLLELIDEVLDISRIEAGRLELCLESVQVASVLRETAEIIRPLAAARDISVSILVAENSEIHVLADRQRLKQVLLNLLANAVKYNRERGSVTVNCELLAGDRVRISVLDTGHGIAEEKRARLFIPFDRLGAEHTTVQGTGLGLALTKRFTEAMGGTLDLESEVEHGSTFWIDLPQAHVAGQGENSGNASSRTLSARKTATILCIEDNISNLALIEHLVRLHPQLKLVSAMQGGLGLELARRHQPDIIALDVHLPDMDGAEVLHRLRADPVTRDIPVVILSADATARQIERLRNAGACDYLTKPLNVKRFIEVIEEQTQNREPKRADP